MSAASPTLLPRESRFPLVLPHLNQPYIKPLPRKVQVYGRLNAYRNLEQEIADLEDEETSLDTAMRNIRDRGFNFLVPIGRNLTQQEEKNDEDDGEDDDVDDSGSEEGASQPSTQQTDASEEDEDEDEEEEEEDLDASMEDRDEDDEEDEDEEEED
ncbi:uncharacterized protein SCHCODRAFT_02526445 [Schizophyllum commune H4-8]|nr:uncharacterized protein SCHCODRAFT_02526445 [Schizophyllum commune H4-8]KAI5900431.1 hypothetical protein SCHCODRAFT_02526445 [Schizophyllum commune H4-8]